MHCDIATATFSGPALPVIRRASSKASAEAVETRVPSGEIGTVTESVAAAAAKVVHVGRLLLRHRILLGLVQHKRNLVAVIKVHHGMLRKETGKRRQ